MAWLDNTSIRRGVFVAAAVVVAAVAVAGSVSASAASAQPKLSIPGAGFGGVGDLGLGWTADRGQPGLEPHGRCSARARER